MHALIAQFGLQQIQMIPPAIVTGFLLYFLGRYLWLYRRAAVKVRKELSAYQQKVRALGQDNTATALKALRELFANASNSLKSAWEEYEETLHEQYASVDGEYQLAKVRATVQSSAYFGSHNLVDLPLRAEYFRHLPGIVTGIGIIGTFAGLLIGLWFFDSSDPAKIQDSVAILLHGVKDAFFASALAITVAMYITNSEKKHLRICYENLEKLTEGIDRKFEAGVGEEYLAELVKSSTESAQQARQLKDGLVSDLREMLQNLVDSQVQENLKLTATLGHVYRDSGKDIAASISTSIEKSFTAPLQQIANSVQSISQDQSGHVHGLLQDVLMAFMNKLDASFGQQFNGLHEMMGQSVTAMQQMQGAFQHLITEMQHAGESSSQAIHEQLNQAMSQMSTGQAAMQSSMSDMVDNLQRAVTAIGSKGEEAGSRMGTQLERLFNESEQRQQRMAEEMGSFVEQMKASVGRGQTETMNEISAAVGRLGDQLGEVMKTMEASRDNLAAGATQAQQLLQDNAKSLMLALGDNVKALLDGIEAQHLGTTEALRQIDEVTRASINHMQAGADSMRSAAERFGSASESALKLMDASGEAAQQFTNSGASVMTATQALSTQIATYQGQQQTMQQLLSSIENIVTSQQDESTSRTKLVTDITQVVNRMQEMNSEATRYLEGIGDVLERSFDQFGNGIENNLKRTLGSLDQELGKAVGALAGGVQEIAESVEDLSGTLDKLRA